MILRPVVELSFDPTLRIGALLEVRWQALALAAIILLSLAVFLVRLRLAVGSVRADDVAFVLLAAIPGAVVGGRLVHVLVYREAYSAAPSTILDLGLGSLSLTGAVVGGAITAGYVCRLLGHRVGPWADAAATPLMLAIGLGKLAMVLGGGGQGVPFEGPLALAFLGEGPWWSADPAVPAHPSQVYEGLWVLFGIVPVSWIGGSLARGPRRGQGLVLLLALAWWSAGRVVVALTWRDEPWVGPLGGEAVASAALLAGSLVTIGVVARRAGRPPGATSGAPWAPDDPRTVSR